MGMADLWYENAIIYCLDVETFCDSDGDGVGDFRGLTRKLDYLASLGISCVWLNPFFPSPNRDDAYDVADFCSVDPRFGNLADFVEFTNEAKERGMRVIVDLVANHTSDQHPWFQQARADPKSKYRDYYVWRTDDPGDTSDKVVFPGEQEGIWTYDELAKAWYLHHFYHFQPDLNWSNPAVRDEMRRIAGLWLELGVSGFRIDAAPFIIDPTGVGFDPMAKDPHQYLLDLRDFISLRGGDAIMLGEVDLGPTLIAEYFGGGNEFQLLFNFLLSRDMWLALAHEAADPLVLGLKDLPTIPRMGQWVNFLRHHDELNLSRLTEQQRQDVFKAFAPDPDMQIYDRGLRRRLAPMMRGDRRRMEMAWSLLFTLPGVPMIYYGEEVGMGENLDLKGRLAVRGPMQWSAGANGGFSDATPEGLVRPTVASGTYGYRKVNVTGQRSDRGSLLNWMASLVRARKECPEFGWGSWEVIRVDQPSCFATRSEWDDGGVAIALHNFSSQRCIVTLDLPAEDVRNLMHFFGDRAYEPFDGKQATVRLEPYGYCWMRVGGMR
jgi:maltose alpha-D-glucosyltransferase/alpha-amylase